MKINVLRLVDPRWEVSSEGNLIRLWYRLNRGNHIRKPFVLPYSIKVDTQFAEAIGMIIGDGDMHNRNKTHLSYASKDMDIARFILDFLRYRFNINIRDVTLFINHGSNLPDLRKISNGLNVQRGILRTFRTNRNRYPAVHIQVNGVVFRLIFEKIVNEFLASDFLVDNELRRGFLRGLFAAEGCVGIKYQEHFINQIGFSLSVKERDYLDLLQKALILEGISFKEVQRKNCVDTIIQNWQNYLKCWQIRLFDRCERKKQSFLSIAHTSKVYGVLADDDLRLLSRRFTQRNLAKLVGSWQGNVSRMLKGKILFSLRQIRLLERLGLNLTIRKLRIGSLTELPYSLENRLLFEPVI